MIRHETNKHPLNTSFNHSTCHANSLNYFSGVIKRDQSQQTSLESPYRLGRWERPLQEAVQCCMSDKSHNPKIRNSSGHTFPNLERSLENGTRIPRLSNRSSVRSTSATYRGYHPRIWEGKSASSKSSRVLRPVHNKFAMVPP